MIRSLNTGVLGIKQFQTSLDAIGNNLANINTIGFKGARVDFSDTLSQTLRAPTPDTATVSGSSGMQLGNGMQVSAIKNQFTQGAIKQTGVRTDLAVTGEGFFLVKDPTTSELYATRAGDFREDKNGYLVTNDGHRVQGLHKQAPAYSESEKTEIGDLKVDVGHYMADRSGVQLDYSSNRFTLNGHGYVTGNQVKFLGATPTLSVGSNTNSTVYYIKKLDEHNFTLHTTAADAASGANSVNFVKQSITGLTGFTTDVANNKLIKASSGIATGDTVYLKGDSVPGGITAGQTYYARVSDGAATATTQLTRGPLSTSDKWSGSNSQTMICELGATSGNLEYRWEHFSAADKVEIYYEGTKIWHTGTNPLSGEAQTVSGSGSATIPINGTSNELKIIVNDGILSSASVWEMWADGGIPITPKTVSETSLQTNSSITLHPTAADATAGTKTVNITNTGADYKLYKDDGSSTDLVLTLGGGASITSYNVGADGKINMLLTDGTQYVRGQVLLQNFTNPQALLKQGSNLFGNLATAGPIGVSGLSASATDILKNSKAPGSSGVGRVAAGSLELANVDMAREFSNMITTQRAFQANARVVTTSDEILREMMALKR